jgi:hypothetical protein
MTLKSLIKYGPRTPLNPHEKRVMEPLEIRATDPLEPLMKYRLNHRGWQKEKHQSFHFNYDFFFICQHVDICSNCERLKCRLWLQDVLNRVNNISVCRWCRCDVI